ncbi:MAG: CBS domain-containing protein [Nitrospirota bacterium]
MKVKGLLESKGKEIVSIDADSSVEDAIRLMHSKKVSAVLVNEREKTVGIFTERDVVRSYVSKNGKKFREIQLKDAMTSDLITAGQDDNVGDIMTIMVRNNIRHLPVMENGSVIGMLSIRDVIGL